MSVVQMISVPLDGYTFGGGTTVVIAGNKYMGLF